MLKTKEQVKEVFIKNRVYDVFEETLDMFMEHTNGVRLDAISREEIENGWGDRYTDTYTWKPMFNIRNTEDPTNIFVKIEGDAEIKDEKGDVVKTYPVTVKFHTCVTSTNVVTMSCTIIAEVPYGVQTLDLPPVKGECKADHVPVWDFCIYYVPGESELSFSEIFTNAHFTACVKYFEKMLESTLWEITNEPRKDWGDRREVTTIPYKPLMN